MIPMQKRMMESWSSAHKDVEGCSAAMLFKNIRKSVSRSFNPKEKPLSLPNLESLRVKDELFPNQQPSSTKPKSQKNLKKQSGGRRYPSGNYSLLSSGLD